MSDIKKVKISEVTPFAGYPFEIIDDDRMHELVEKLFVDGIKTVIEVHKVKDGRYEIIDGHRRFFALNQIGYAEISVRILELDEDEAVLAFVDSNLSKDLTISMQAKLYSMRYDAMRRIAKRTKKRPMKKGKRQAIDYALADIVGKSRGDLHRYFRMAHVIPEIMDLVDIKAVAITTAVEISFLNETVQKWIYEYMKENGACMDYQIKAVREYLEDHKDIYRIDLIRILNENAPRDLSNRFQRIILTKPTLRKYFPPFYTKTQMENVIFRLLAEWHKENVEDV